MAQNDLVIRVGGESGEGIVTTGEIFARIAAFSGLEVYTFRTYPAEILGGHVMLQVRLSDRPIYSQGDVLDVLVAFNQEGYDKHHQELCKEGVLIYDSSEISLPDDGEQIRYPLPLTELADEMGFRRGKNFVAIGAMVKLFGLPYETSQEIVRQRLGGKGEEMLRQNLAALEAGYRYVEERIEKKDAYLLRIEGLEVKDRLVLSGNQAIAMGAIAAGCRFYAGYPITPATDIMEFLATHLPKMGGTVIQAEDEMAALSMVLGASFAGQRAMTATSGPGLSLMSELVGLASMAEVPAVIVDVQRAGPSTGMPTKTAQGDLYLALHGSHDEGPRIVLAPTSVEDCFYQMVNAFNLAEKYQMPVIFLSDQSLSHRVETTPPFQLSEVEVMERLTPDLSEGTVYQRYEYTETGVSPMALPGQAGGQYTAEGLEHLPSGAPNYDPEIHRAMMEKRFRKVRSAAQEMKEWGMVRRYGDPQPLVGLVGWGSTEGPVREAVERAQERGLKVATLYPRVLKPLPEAEIREFLAPLATVIVPEVNYTGQLAHLLQAHFRVQTVPLNKYEGIPFTSAEVFEKIEEVYEELRLPVEEGVR
ncbi:MAG: 2-oxoacid:acceptor oxidoreductase subunit alpha [Anaerolineae bacterium]